MTAPQLGLDSPRGRHTRPLLILPLRVAPLQRVRQEARAQVRPSGHEQH
jgi:hypothetical protein